VSEYNSTHSKNSSSLYISDGYIAETIILIASFLYISSSHKNLSQVLTKTSHFFIQVIIVDFFQSLSVISENRFHSEFGLKNFSISILSQYQSESVSINLLFVSIIFSI
jgi:hypothetical protein